MPTKFGQWYGKPGSSDHFPKGNGCKSWFFIMSAGTKLKCAFIICSQIVLKQKIIKCQNLDFFKDYISIVLHFYNLDFKCPKMVAKRGNMAIAEQLGSYATILHYYVPLDETWQITKNIIN